MPYNGSGVASIPNSFTPTTTILSSAVNANFVDVASMLSSVLVRDGQAAMSGALRLADGSEALPGLSFSNDTNTGFRRSGTDVMEWVAGGSDRMFIDANGKAWLLGALDVVGLTTLAALLTTAAGIVSNSVSATELDGRRFAADTNGAVVGLSKSRHASIGSHTVVEDGDSLGLLAFNGSDGTNFERAADIAAVVDGTPGNNDMPGALVLATTADGAASTTERLAIRASGKIQVPNRSAPVWQLDPSGYTDLSEIADPGAPAANTARFFAFDVGGTTHLAYLDSADTLRVFTEPPARAFDSYDTNEDLTTAIPLDDSIPQQSTEGTLIMDSGAFTLKRANSRVRIRAEAFGRCVSSQGDDNRNWTMALHVDSTENALKAVTGGINNDNIGVSVVASTVLVHEYAPGSVGPFTYKIHVGSASGNVLRLNGAAARQYGGVAAATLVVEEVFV